MTYFIIIFGIVIFFVVDFLGSERKFTPYATIAFIVGSITSMICGYIGMAIAV